MLRVALPSTRLSQALRVPLSAVSFAGIKDKVAITTQVSRADIESSNGQPTWGFGGRLGVILSSCVEAMLRAAVELGGSWRSPGWRQWWGPVRGSVSCPR